MDTLPPLLQERIFAYKLPVDRAARLAGKLLLRHVLGIQDSDCSQAMDRLRYSAAGKPFIPGVRYGFSLSYSGRFAFLAFNGNGDIGIDAERVDTAADIAYYEDLLAPAGGKRIGRDHDPGTLLHRWTRKEAVLKAAGSGFLADDQSRLSPEDNPVLWNGKNWYTQSLPHPECIVHVAAALPPGNVSCDYIALA